MLSQSTLINVLILLVVMVVGYIVVRELRNIRQQVKVQKAQIKKMKQELMHGVIESDMTNIDFRRIEPPAQPVQPPIYFANQVSSEYPGYDEVVEDDDMEDEVNHDDEVNHEVEDEVNHDDEVNHEVEDEVNHEVEDEVDGEVNHEVEEEVVDQSEIGSGDDVSFEEEIDEASTEVHVDQNNDGSQISDEEKTEEIDLSLDNHENLELETTNINDIFQDDGLVKNDEPLELNFRRPKLRLQFKKK